VSALPAPLIVITDRHQARLPLETIAQAVGPGGWLLLRDKDMAPADRRALAARLADVARHQGTHLSISRDIDLAAEFCASLHLQSAVTVGAARRHLAPGAMIGVSAHSQDEVAAAAAAGADYVTLSPIFLTASKPGYGPALGVAAIGGAIQFGVPILALGGMTAETIASCIDAGAAGVAVMGEVMRSEHPERTIRMLRLACKSATLPEDFSFRRVLAAR
jgi:thiamine-phosphate pyrophosphorylase